MGRPIPLLLVQGRGVSSDSLAALRESRRAQVVHFKDVASNAPAFAARSARATIVATLRDPMDELVYARTSGFSGPLVLAVQARYADLRESLMAAGVVECMALPMTTADVDRVLDLVDALPASPTAHAPLDLVLDAVDRTARRGRSFVRLSQREFALLHCLVQHATRPVATSEILEYVWGSQRRGAGTREILDVNVSQLRKKLKRIGLRDAIRTYRGFGYGLRGEAASDAASQDRQGTTSITS